MSSPKSKLLALVTWLQTNPSLEELQKRFPDDWALVDRELASAVREKDGVRLDALLRPRSAFAFRPTERLGKREARELMTRFVRQRMAAGAIERFMSVSLTEHRAHHLGYGDQIILRCLFFDRNYRRKLVPQRLFRLLWPLLRAPNLLQPLAEAHGIYGFYGKDFITGLAALIGRGPCIEIAAGDGVLARLLKRSDVELAAYDDQSWAGKVMYGRNVVKLDAGTALRRCNPRIVLCSWPPPMNDFERHVFETPSVRRYVVIGSERRLAFGNWPAYLSQSLFTIRKEEHLSACLLPPSFRGAVYVFDRI